MRSPTNRLGELSALLAIGVAGCLTLGGCVSGPDSAAPHPEETAPAPMTTAPVDPTARDDSTAIRIVVNDQVVTGVLWNNATSRSLIDQLPLTLTFEDLNRVEKIGRIPRPLSMDGMPEGDDPEPDEIGYYAPSGDLVLYYGDVGYWPGIARIGQFTSDLAPVHDRDEDFTATIELDQ